MIKKIKKINFVVFRKILIKKRELFNNLLKFHIKFPIDYYKKVIFIYKNYYYLINFINLINNK